mmetsp:Transcript_36257/g.87382  ORF Transcript_36257/g.87382 Transcript_36257/m.87382 type:complete len:80 (-) Transcript_36257:139-378(-)
MYYYSYYYYPHLQRLHETGATHGSTSFFILYQVSTVVVQCVWMATDEANVDPQKKKKNEEDDSQFDRHQYRTIIDTIDN